MAPAHTLTPHPWHGTDAGGRAHCPHTESHLGNRQRAASTVPMGECRRSRAPLGSRLMGLNWRGGHALSRHRPVSPQCSARLPPLARLQRTPSPRSQSSCAPSRASCHFPRRLSQAGPTSGCLGIALTSRRAARTKTAARTRRREPSWAARLECEAPAAASQQARPMKSANHRLRQGRESCSDARRRPRRTRAPADAAGAVARENRSAGSLADRPRPADDSPIAGRPPGSTPKIWQDPRRVA